MKPRVAPLFGVMAEHLPGELRQDGERGEERRLGVGDPQLSAVLGGF